MKLSTLRDEIRESKEAALVLGHDCGPLSPKDEKRGDQSFQVILPRCSNYTLHSINYSSQHTANQVSCNKGKRSNKVIEACEACERLTQNCCFSVGMRRYTA